MEIARLEAIIDGDVKPLIAALDQGEAKISQFAHTGEVSFLKLNAGLSKTAQAALAAATDIKGLKSAIQVLENEQSGIIRGTTLWTQYENELKKLDAQLETTILLEEEFGATASKTGSRASVSFAGIGKGLTGMLGGLRSIAYILPGIGIAGIFNAAFEAISEAADSLFHFTEKAKAQEEETKRIDAVFNSLEQSIKSANDALGQSTLDIQEASRIYASFTDDLEKLRKKHADLADELARLAAPKFTEIAEAQLAEQAKAGVQSAILADQIAQHNLELQKNINAAILANTKKSYADRFAAAKNILAEEQALNRNSLDQQIQQAGQNIQKIKEAEEAFRFANLKAQQNYNLAVLQLQEKQTDDYKKQVEERLKAEQKWQTMLNKTRDLQLASLADLLEANKRTEQILVGNAAGIKPTNFKVNTEGFDAFLERLDTAKSLAEELSGIFIDMFETLATTGRLTFRDLSHEVIRFVASLAKAAIEAAILRAILSFINPATALTGSQITSIVNAFGKIPMLAGGGVVNSPTLAVVGESGPEAVIPLNQLSNLAINNSQNIIVTGRISGSDIVLVQNRQNQRNNRNYGLNFN